MPIFEVEIQWSRGLCGFQGVKTQADSLQEAMAKVAAAPLDYFDAKDAERNGIAGEWDLEVIGGEPCEPSE